MLFTDSRYYLQAGNQLSDDWTLMKMEPKDPTIEEVIFDKLKGKRVGIDPFQFSFSKFKAWTEKWVKKSEMLKRKVRQRSSAATTPLAM
jgi:Xaa-Pro aminopeptidase